MGKLHLQGARLRRIAICVANRIGRRRSGGVCLHGACITNVAQHHNRMPVVLDNFQFDEWMRGTLDQAAALMKP